MKKKYINPAIETVKMQSAFVICDVTVGGEVEKEPTIDPFNPAPGRKPF